MISRILKLHNNTSKSDPTNSFMKHQRCMHAMRSFALWEVGDFESTDALCNEANTIHSNCKTSQVLLIHNGDRTFN